MVVPIPAAERTLDILTVLAQAHGPMTATGIAREIGIPRSTMYQLLEVLAERGFVTHVAEDHRWALGLTAFEVGSAYLRSDPLERIAQPLLQRLALSAPIPVVAHLGVLRGHEIVYLLKEHSEQMVTTVTEVGVRLPASLTASGRAILMCLTRDQVRAQMSSKGAFVDRTGAGPQSLTALQALLASERRQGYCEEDGFITAGYASVAVPVRSQRGEPVAALGVIFRTDLTDEDLRTVLAQAAQRCGADIEYRLAPKGRPKAPRPSTLDA